MRIPNLTVGVAPAAFPGQPAYAFSMRDHVDRRRRSGLIDSEVDLVAATARRHIEAELRRRADRPIRSRRSGGSNPGAGSTSWHARRPAVPQRLKHVGDRVPQRLGLLELELLHRRAPVPGDVAVPIRAEVRGDQPPVRPVARAGPASGSPLCVARRARQGHDDGDGQDGDGDAVRSFHGGAPVISFDTATRYVNI